MECSQGCGEVYCSEDCRQQHFERCHHLLCVGPIPAEEAPSHPLVQFRVRHLNSLKKSVLLERVEFPTLTTRDSHRCSQIHAAETNEIFLLVGEVVARIISSYMKNGNNVEDAEAPFADFVRGAWWDVVIAREDGPRSHKGATATSQEVGTLPQTLRDLCEQSSSLLRKALGVPSTLERVISTERFGTIIGMFEQNNVGIRVPPLISQALISMLEGEENVAKGIVHNVTTRLAELLADIDEEAECSDAENCVGEEGDESEDCDSTSVADEEREESCVAFDEAMNILHKVLPCEKELFPPLDGTALYTLICCMNHSCSPNCSIEYSGKTSDMIEKKADQMIARVVLLENVTEGEELTQSYIDTQLGLEERRRALEEYGFWCRCKRCVQEEGEWEENNTKAR